MKGREDIERKEGKEGREERREVMKRKEVKEDELTLFSGIQKQSDFL